MTALTILAGAIGIYSGINVLIPLACAGVTWWVVKKTAPASVQPYSHAIAIQIGHTCWLTLGLAILNQWGANTIDIAVIAIGIAWLWLKPGLWPIILLTIFQAIALFINAAALAAAPLAGTEHKALVVHVALRLAALFYMWHTYVTVRRLNANAAIDASQVADPK